LGRKLTKELGLDESVDTLGRWMAHHIAELIRNAEKSSAKERPAKDKACFDAILKLWEKRHLLPGGTRPFEGIEPVIRAIESLDPESDLPRYYTPVFNALDEDEEIENDEAKSWLELAKDVDRSAKVLIGFFLAEAARSESDSAKEWKRLAEEAGLNSNPERFVLRFVSPGEDEITPEEERKKLIQNRIDLMETFAKKAKDIALKLRGEIAV